MHVFISYVIEDANPVAELADRLRGHGVIVWLDKTSLQPGDRWRNAIRTAIRTGDFFVACFSDNYLARKSSYMNEELRLAIDELRLHPIDRSWFIPVLLTNCTVPDIPIGASETLRDFQYIELWHDYERAFHRLLNLILPRSNEALIDRLLRDVESNDINLVRLALTKLSTMGEWGTERLMTEVVDVMIRENILNETAVQVKDFLVRSAPSTMSVLARRLTERQTPIAYARIISALGFLCSPESIADTYPDVASGCSSTLQSNEHDRLYYPYSYWSVEKSVFERLSACGSSAWAKDFRSESRPLDFNVVFGNRERCEECGHDELIPISSEEKYDSGDCWYERTYVCAFCGKREERYVDA